MRYDEIGLDLSNTHKHSSWCVYTYWYPTRVLYLPYALPPTDVRDGNRILLFISMGVFFLRYMEHPPLLLVIIFEACFWLARTERSMSLSVSDSHVTGNPFPPIHSCKIFRVIFSGFRRQWSDILSILLPVLSLRRMIPNVESLAPPSWGTLRRSSSGRVSCSPEKNY